MNEFIWPVRVYYEDTDSGGVVYYANYLKFMERARTEWLRSLGIEQDQLRDRDGILFAVRSVTIDYRKPARFNDQLDVVSSISQTRKASLTFQQRVVHSAADSAEPLVLCDAAVKVACLDASTFTPRSIPETLLAEIAGER
jgi:acyl-CoA thioester hydrolase